MAVTSSQRALFAAVLALCLTSCAGDSAPKPGTPPYLWAKAVEAASAGDAAKAAEQLEKVASSTGELRLKGQAWMLVLTSGLARGYADLGDSFANGGRANKSNPTPFRKQATIYRGLANRYALQSAEVMAEFDKGAEENIPLAFPFPGGSAAPVTQLTTAASGILPSQAELAPMEKRAIERGVLLAASRAAGVDDDAAKAQELFKASSPQVARTAFLLAMAQTLYDQSQLYSSTKLDEPEKLKLFCNRALAAAKKAPESKQTKELIAKINDAIKKAK
jgi:hypothetical protein